MTTETPLVAIVGNVSTHKDSPKVAEDLGRELAKAGMRILVYSSAEDFVERPIVRGYIDSQKAAHGSIQIRYPFSETKPEFPEQETNAQAFDWRPDDSLNWEVSFYRSLSEVDGIVLLGGGDSTLIAGQVALSHRIAVLTLPEFEGATKSVWASLRPGEDLVSPEEKALMARPGWSSERAAEVVQTINSQLERRAEEARKLRVEQLRKETSLSWHALGAVAFFLSAIGSVVYAWGQGKGLEPTMAMLLLFVSPLLAGVAGATIRLVLDLRQGTIPLSRQSTITTAALGVIAGGIAGLLFITAQVSTMGDSVTSAQSSRLVPFGVIIGFIAGLTLDAVFRKLLASDVVDLSAIKRNKGS